MRLSAFGSLGRTAPNPKPGTLNPKDAKRALKGKELKDKPYTVVQASAAPKAQTEECGAPVFLLLEAEGFHAGIFVSSSLGFRV